MTDFANPEGVKIFNKGIVDQFERESTALYGTAHLWDDGIIDPRDTRRVLAFTLSIARESKMAGRSGPPRTTAST